MVGLGVRYDILEKERIGGVNRNWSDGDTERLERIGQAILAAARDELYLGMRFLDVALSSFEYQMNTEISPFGTDGSTIYFHPREMGGLYKQNRILVNRGYLHMVYHCLFRHMLKIIPKQEENFRDVAIWHVTLRQSISLIQMISALYGFQEACSGEKRIGG